MKFRIRTLSICLLGALVASGAQAQYLLSPMAGNGQGNAGQLQIGTGLPLPVGPAGIFIGGMTPVNGGTMAPPPAPAVDGPGITYWPPLLIGRAPSTMGTIMQNLSTAAGGQINIPPNVLSNMIGAARIPIAVFPTNPAVFQVRTTINYKWPSAAAVFAPGAGPGIPGTTVVLPGPGGGSIAYQATAKNFGGAAQFAIAAGPFSGTVKVPPGGTMGSKLPVASVWINAFKKLPASATRALLVGASNYNGLGAAGAPGTTTATTMFGQVPLAVRQFTGMLPILGPAGTVPLSMSFGLANNAATNMVTGTKGFPWTTGFIVVTAPGAAPAEIFYQSGQDLRVAGVGNISMVSGALGQRKLSLANANRGWVTLTLPEPTAALGAAAALSVLGLCHMLVRRRAN
jgi:hypothetical protein